MSLDKDTVRKIAFLARIQVPAEALDGLSGELSKIIDWVEQLNEVDTKDVEPMTSVADMDWPRRDDEITDGGRAADILANATDPEPGPGGGDGGFFTVPKVVE